MVIVNQNKTQILNFDNIQDIRIEPYGTHMKGKKIYKIFAGNFEGYATELGTYDTEERAKGLLKEIIQKIEDTSMVNLMENLQMSIHDPNFGGSLSSVYYMPEDKED